MFLRGRAIARADWPQDPAPPPSTRLALGPSMSTSSAFALGLTLAISLAAASGCAAPAADTPAVVDDAEINEFKVRRLSRFTPEDLLVTYRARLGDEIRVSVQENPSVKSVDASNVDVFAGARPGFKASRRILAGSAWWYLDRTRTAIAVDQMEATLFDYVRDGIESSAGDDGFFKISNERSAPYPVAIWDCIPATQIAAAVRNTKASAGIDLATTFALAERAWSFDGLLLPVAVPKKPIAEQLKNIYSLGDDVEAVDDAETNAKIFELVAETLTPAFAERTKTLPASWYFRSPVRGSDTHYTVIFMDDHSQIWGFDISVAAD